MNSQDFKKYHLPDFPGVYFFKEKKEVIYIGKASSLKDRVRSYFSADLINTRGQFLVDMIFRADKIDFIKTDSVLEALILESNLIKKHQPKYNTKEKDNKSFNYVVITKEDWPRVLIERGRNLLGGRGSDFEESKLFTFGPFTNNSQLKEALKIIRKIFPFRDKCQLNQKKPCFNYQIGLCPGICIGAITKANYKKNIKNIQLFFQGKKKKIIKNLEKEMLALAKESKYELAQIVRNKIYALNHIQDVALIMGENGGERSDLRSAKRSDLEEPFRIEAYDVAHLSGTNNVGVMVVMEGGEFKKSDYRKFIIRQSKGSDTGALAEILERRLKHLEWRRPDLIVVDGGLAQLNVAKKAIAHEHNRPVHQNGHSALPGQQTRQAGLTKAGIDGRLVATFVVAVTKDEKHRPKAIIGNEKIVQEYKKQILEINNEAHCFALKYHRSKRALKH